MSTVSVRFKSATMDKLRSYRDNLQVAVNRDPARFQKWTDATRLSLNDALDYLLLQQSNHSKRGKTRFDAGGRQKDDHVEQENESLAPLRDPDQFIQMIPGEQH